MIQAVIFDLDGTIFDNEQLWEDAFEQVLKISSEKWIHEPGLGIKDNLKRIIGTATTEQKVSEVVEKYHSLSSDLILREGTVELVQKIKDLGWQTALATGSFWHTVEAELERLSMELAFDVTTTGEEVLLSKPDAEIYLLTAQKLNLEPAEIVVIEDAIAGVRAAAEAEMKVIGMVSEYAPAELLKSAGAFMTIENFSEIEPELLK